MGSLAEFQQRAVCGRYSVPLNIQAVYGFKGLFPRTARHSSGSMDSPAICLKTFAGIRMGGAVRIHSHQESAAGRRLAVGTDYMLTLDKQGVMPASAYCF